MIRCVIVALIVFGSCQNKKETELQKLCREVRQTPQDAFPGANDTKWQLIKKMDSLNDDAKPDSLRSIFGHIDTSIKGYSSYHYAILTQLLKPESAKSLEALAGIYKDNYISDPSSSQVITQIFADRSLWGEQLASQITGKNLVDYAEVLQNVPVMFPELAQILGQRPFSDGPVLNLMNMAIGAGVLDKDNLASSKTALMDYYNRLKQIRDGQSRPFSNGYDYSRYYDTHFPNLVSVLRVFSGDPEIDAILKESIGTSQGAAPAVGDSTDIKR